MDIQKSVATILHYKLKVLKKTKTQIAVIAAQARGLLLRFSLPIHWEFPMPPSIKLT